MVKKSIMIRTKTISVSYQEFDSTEELEDNDRELVNEASKAALNAYAPYSMFRVGAALRLENGIIVKGVNVENAAFPSGICAERSAIAAFISGYPKEKLLAIAIAALTDEGLTAEPVTPCGNCRQAIAEEESRNGMPLKIILAGQKKTIVIDGINNLLPLQFSKNILSPPTP
jgi:cytidine deaminase